MRLGQNPAKDTLPAYRPPRLGVVVATYIPSLAGYYEHSLEIFKYQLASLHFSTKIDFDLLVFDNGSCREVQTELERLEADGWIDFLVASRHNLGKIGVLNWALAAMPNELICYADSDVLFRSGWIENSLKVMETFPGAGMVSAQPCLDDVLHGEGKAERILQGDPRFEISLRPLEPAVIEEYALGVSMSPDRIAKLKNTASRVVVDRKTGQQAVIGATHMQFLIPRSIAQKVIPLPVTFGLGRAEDHNFDLRVDQAGALHLSTLEAYVWHMGNIPDEKTLEEVRGMGLPEMQAPAVRGKASTPHSLFIRICRRLARGRVLRGIVYRLYSFLFQIYAQ